MCNATAAHASVGVIISGLHISAIISLISAICGGNLHTAICFFNAIPTIAASSSSKNSAHMLTALFISTWLLNLSELG
jgi:hypothetical protein